MCVMYVGMIETRFLKILLNSFHENYSDLFKTTTRYVVKRAKQWQAKKFAVLEN